MPSIIAYSVHGDRVEIDPTMGICEDARFIFTNGQCHALAFALFEIFTSMDKRCGLIATSRPNTHFALHLPDMDDAVIDVDGIHMMSDFLEECGTEADDEAWMDGYPVESLPDCYYFASILQAEDHCENHSYDIAHMRAARLYAQVVIEHYDLS